MRAFTRLRFWRIWRYRLSILGVCVAYLLAALEIPLPVFAHKDSSQPFPCQDHPCGCQTAEQCWSHCCCFTVEERWAWARAHHIEPPAYAEKPAERPAVEGWNTPKLRDRAKEAAAPAKSCCAAHEDRPSCCERSSAPSAKPAPATKGRLRWGTTMTAWRCQGYSTLWVSVGAVLPGSPRDAWVPDCTPPVYLPLSSIRADRIASTPLDPPPRLSFV
jgi:hypothetical protein